MQKRMAKKISKVESFLGSYLGYGSGGEFTESTGSHSHTARQIWSWNPNPGLLMSSLLGDTFSSVKLPVAFKPITPRPYTADTTRFTFKFIFLNHGPLILNILQSTDRTWISAISCQIQDNLAEIKQELLVLVSDQMLVVIFFKVLSFFFLHVKGKEPKAKRLSLSEAKPESEQSGCFIVICLQFTQWMFCGIFHVMLFGASKEMGFHCFKIEELNIK